MAVCVNYRRNREAAEAVVRSIEETGAAAMAVAADVAVESDVMRLFDAVDETLGPLAALVNNAGILETQMRVDAMDAARLHRIFATNVIGAFLCAREAVRRMSTRHGGAGGAIVNVSSGAARLGSPGRIRRLRRVQGRGRHADDRPGAGSRRGRHSRQRGAPGFIYTDMHASGGEPNRVDRVKAFVPMKRGGTAGEVANAILWLLSTRRPTPPARSST